MEEMGNVVLMVLSTMLRHHHLQNQNRPPLHDATARLRDGAILEGIGNVVLKVLSAMLGHHYLHNQNWPPIHDATV